VKPKKRGHKIMAIVNELAEIIYKETRVTRGKLMVLANIASSTLYAYEKILLETHKDIVRVGNDFVFVPEEK